MTEEIEHAMRLARDCSHKMATPANWHALQSALEAIEAKARAEERERCAKVCDEEAAKWRGEQDITDFRLCANLIRALT